MSIIIELPFRIYCKNKQYKQEELDFFLKRAYEMYIRDVYPTFNLDSIDNVIDEATGLPIHMVYAIKQDKKLLSPEPFRDYKVVEGNVYPKNMSVIGFESTTDNKKFYRSFGGFKVISDGK
jgi:RNAse (barnase) inhibitor barstar